MGIQDKIQDISIYLYHTLRFSFKKYYKDRCGVEAASLSFQTLVGLVPLFTILISMITLFGKKDQIIESVQNFILKYFMPIDQDQSIVKEYLIEFTGKAGTFNIIGFIALMITVLFLFLNIESAINRIFYLKQSRSIWDRFSIFTIIIFWGPLLLFLSFFLSTKVELALTSYISNIAFTQKIVLYLFPLTVTAAGLFIFYYFMPNTRITVKTAFITSIFTGILWEGLKIGFIYYMSQVPFYKNIYGSLSTIPILFLWSYVSWSFVLLGVVLTYTIDNYNHKYSDNIYLDEVKNRLVILIHIIRVLNELKILYAKNQYLNLKDIKSKKDFFMLKAVEILKQGNIIGLSGQGNNLISLTMPPEKVSLMDIQNVVYGSLQEVAKTELSNEFEDVKNLISEIYKERLGSITISSI